MKIDLQKLAFDQAPVGIALTEQRVIRACNATFCKLFGYDKPALIGQSFRMLYQEEKEFEQIRDIGIARLKEGGEYSDERLVYHRNGEMFWCRFRAVTLTPDDPLARTVLSFAPIPDHVTDYSLTKRERQVVGFLSKGLTSKEIARRLTLSPRTVEDYRLRLCKKFNVKNTTELLSHLVALEG